MRDTTAFDLEVLIRNLLEDFDEKRAGRPMKVPLFTEEAEPSGESSTIMQAVLDLDGSILVDTDDGLRFRVKVTKAREARRRREGAWCFPLPETPSQPRNRTQPSRAGLGQL